MLPRVPMGRCELVHGTDGRQHPEVNLGTSIADSAYGIGCRFTYRYDLSSGPLATMVQPAGDGGGESIFVTALPPLIV
jgi:hypothetical protein